METSTHRAPPAHRPERAAAARKGLAWAGLFALVAADALVFSNISVGVAYFVPLVVMARSGDRRQTVWMALTCFVARLLFGPTGDPLGLRDVAYILDAQGEMIANTAMALLGYVGVGWLLVREHDVRRLRDEAELDPLTTLANRRGLNAQLAHQSGRQGGLLMIDLDKFKLVNDQWGHEAGDRVLQEVAERLRSSVRPGDLAARFGGEEFVVVLPGANHETALLVANRIHAAIRAQPVSTPDASITVTASVGLAAGRIGPGLLEAADKAAYTAKLNGRDRVEVADPIAAPVSAPITVQRGT
ncbi:MAG: GGDEF domain-containing protein [Myxococcota bacterium]